MIILLAIVLNKNYFLKKHSQAVNINSPTPHNYPVIDYHFY